MREREREREREKERQRERKRERKREREMVTKHVYEEVYLTLNWGTLFKNFRKNAGNFAVLVCCAAAN